LSFGEHARVSVNYTLSMCLDDQRAGVAFGASVRCSSKAKSSIEAAHMRAQNICEAILPEKLKEVQLLVSHLKNTKDKIEKGALNPLAKADDAK